MHTANCAFVSVIGADVSVRSFRVSDAVDPATAQFLEPRYEPETRIEPAPIANVPENRPATEPVAIGQESASDPSGVALSPAVGCEHTAICTPVSVMALAVAVAAFNVTEGADAATAQLFGPRYEPETRIELSPTAKVPENDATTEPVAFGQSSCVTPVASPDNAGGVALSPVVG